MSLAGLATSAHAQNVSPAEVAVLPRIIDTLCVDLVADLNGCETAVLLASDTEPDTADLIIFADRRAADGPIILAATRSIAYNGPLFGQSPLLEQAQNGSLRLHAEQVGIGRAPWTETLTIAYRDGDFLIAGRTYTTYDRALGGGFTCDINLLTGDWVTSADRPNPETEETIYEADNSGRLPPEQPLLDDWTWTTPLPTPCAIELDAWWAAAPQ